MAFLLAIDQFTNRDVTAVATTTGVRNINKLDNKFIIPNDATAVNQTITHRSKKLNYLGTINPTKLTKITGTITNIASTPATIFVDEDSRLIAEFVIIARDDKNIF